MNVETLVKIVPMAGNQRNARRRWSEKAFVFCFVTAEDGTIGIGEGWTSYASPRALTATIEDDISPLVIDRKLEDLLAQGRGINEQARDLCVMSGRYGITAVALSAVEMALMDIAAQAAEVPLWRFLGGSTGHAPVYASGGLYRDGATPEDLGREVADWVTSGHRAVKIKVGGESIEEDARRVNACRQAIGSGVALMVDAHYIFTIDEALAFSRAVADCDVTWFEAPIRPDDWAGHAVLAGESPIPLCGNETLPWRDSFAQLGRAGVHYLMPDISACGGITETAAIAAEAESRGGALTLHSSSSIILFLASLHFAASRPATHSVEMHMMHQWLFDLSPGICSVEEGRVSLSDAPGLGINAFRLKAAIAAL